MAATGFGLSALCIAAKRHYLVPSQCEERVERTLAFLLETCPHEHGFLYHFIDIETGQAAVQFGAFFYRYRDTAMRRAAVQAVFCWKREDCGAGHNFLPPNRLAVDAEWRDCACPWGGCRTRDFCRHDGIFTPN